MFTPRDLSLILTLLDQANDNLSIIDLETGRFIYVNQTTCRSSGYTVGEFRRMRVADIDPTVSEKWDKEREMERRRVQHIYYREGQIRRKDGTTFPVEINSVIVSLHGREYMVASSRDTTERVRAGEALRKAHGELEFKVGLRTVELATARNQLQQKVTKLEIAEKALQGAYKKLREKTKALEGKNAALREILGHIESEKKNIRDDVIANIELLLPLLKKMRLGGASGTYIDLLEHGLNKLASSFGRRIADPRFRLTPREIEICMMIREGLTSKEIARLAGVSLQTVQSHRYKIRKKFKVLRRGINLSSYLQKN